MRLIIFWMPAVWAWKAWVQLTLYRVMERIV